MRQQPGLREHGAGAVGEVLERRGVAQGAELAPGDVVAQLRLVAEREEGFAAARCGAGPGDLEHLVEREVRALASPRRTGERAVAANVAAERRQRDEHLRRVRDEATRTLPTGLGEEVVERRR